MHFDDSSSLHCDEDLLISLLVFLSAAAASLPDRPDDEHVNKHES